MPDGQTLKDRATQLLIKYKSGALVTQFDFRNQTMHQNLSWGVGHTARGNEAALPPCLDGLENPC